MIKFLEENSTNEPQTVHVARQLTTQELTGANSADVMSNIYDLEGNNFELTAQAYDIGGRTYRGGSYDFARDGYLCPASDFDTTAPESGRSRIREQKRTLFVNLLAKA